MYCVIIINTQHVPDGFIETVLGPFNTNSDAKLAGDGYIESLTGVETCSEYCKYSPFYEIYELK